MTNLKIAAEMRSRVPMEVRRLRSQGRATGLPAGRPPLYFLPRDDYAEVAEYIAGMVSKRKGQQLVEIRVDGGVLVRPRHEVADDDLSARVLERSVVNIYNRQVLVEHIEDDLLHWMRSAP